MSARKTVMLKMFDEPVIEEFVNAEAIKPGYLVKFDAAGKIVKHATAAGNALPMFAVENSNIGKGIDDNFALGDTTRVWFPKRGERINALVSAAAAAILKGDPLESAGNGTLRKHTPVVASGTGALPANQQVLVNAIVGYAAEAVDNSAGGSEARVAVYAQ